MAYAKTQTGAQKRVALKRAIRAKGVSVASHAPTKKLKSLYKALYPGRKYPKK